jgi:hypothetical protein
MDSHQPIWHLAPVALKEKVTTFSEIPKVQ